MIGTKFFRYATNHVLDTFSAIKMTRHSFFCKDYGNFYPAFDAALKDYARKIHTTAKTAENKITFSFVNRKGKSTVVNAASDDTLLDVVVDNNLDIESFGVCEGTLGCSTCHVILEQKIFDMLQKTCPPTAEEMDMLDLACGLTETSRLGCQVELFKNFKGCTVKVPEEAIDARDL